MAFASHVKITMTRLTRLLSLLTVLLLFVAACSEQQVDPQIADAQQRWEEQQIQSYEYDITFVSMIENIDHTVRVVNGQVVSDAPGTNRANQSIDELFNSLTTLDRDEDARINEITFDLTTGVPTFANVETFIHATDSGYFWRIEDFRRDP